MNAAVNECTASRLRKPSWNLSNENSSSSNSTTCQQQQSESARNYDSIGRQNTFEPLFEWLGKYLLTCSELPALLSCCEYSMLKDKQRDPTTENRKLKTEDCNTQNRRT